MSEPQRYRKKPVIIEAMRWDGSLESAIAIIEWAHRHDVLSLNIREYEPGEDDTTHIMVHTREGVVRAEPGDYIVLESHPTEDRKSYPCKPGIFAATYEAVTGDE